MSNNNEKYMKAMELLAQWSYESKTKLAIMYVDGAEWKLAWEVVPQPPPQPPPPAAVVQLKPLPQRQVAVKQQETPVILQEPVQRPKKGKGKGKKGSDDNRYEAFVATVRKHMIIHEDASVRSCELTDELNKYLGFTVSNHTTTPQFMKRFMEENPGIKRVNAKAGVVYKGLGRKGLEVARQEKQEPVAVAEVRPKFNMIVPKIGKKKIEDKECTECTDGKCEECQMKEENEIEIVYDYTTVPRMDTGWTSGYNKPASTMTHIRMQ